MSQTVESVQAHDTSAEVLPKGSGDHAGTLSSSHKSRPSPDDDIMHFARIGDIRALQDLFDTGRYDAAYRDEEGITPLHWAALNNQFETCHFLITAGADVNAKGGAIAATPAMWAVRNCNYYVVDLLLQHGADPLKTDDQGFNLLQNAVMDGNVFQVMMLLHHDVHVDISDPKGHTSLMWAAYKGYPACIDALLQWGASVSARDELGFTALHWSLVRGHPGCIQKLVEAGADKFAVTNDGKSPAVVAEDMKSVSMWHAALSACGYEKDCSPKKWPLAGLVRDRRTFVNRFFFLWPYFILLVGINIVAFAPIWWTAVLFPLTCFVFTFVAQNALRWAPPNVKNVGNTAVIAGIFAGALFWIGVEFLRKIVWTSVFVAPVSTALFLVLYSLCTYFYFLAMIEDPGYVPRTTSRTEIKYLIRNMLDMKKFDEQSFCIPCAIRKPLRSRHCKRCGRCIAKQDHHCPWIYNCVGVNNHRHFILYLVTLWWGMLFGDIAFYKYLKATPSPEQSPKCTLLAEDTCTFFARDPFNIVLFIFCSLNMLWVTTLMMTQLIQISKGVTTRESLSPLHLHGATAAATAALVAGTPSVDAAEMQDQNAPANATTAMNNQPRKTSFAQTLKTLFGVDTFLAVFAGRRSSDAHALRKNPFTRGVARNARDFFCDVDQVFKARRDGKALLGGEEVDYYSMYEPPPRRWTRIAPVEGPGGVSYQSVTTEETYDDL